ncbi:MAG: hypothetical protein IPM53_18530 [Anaerolineaceae bacterium]|nr:hypothetical protein [Anaerolineaceae bacterium]
MIMKGKNKPPEFDQLMDWLEGRLSEEEAQAVSDRVAVSGEAVQQDVAWLRKFYWASQTIMFAEPPEELTEQLEQRFARYARSRRSTFDYKRLIASLSFDSHKQMARGVRTAVSSGTQRQLVYNTEPATIICTLQQRSSGEQFDLLGQVLPLQESDASLIHVLLLQEQKTLDSTLTDDLGEFNLKALSTGAYELILSGEHFEITIPALELSV